MAGAVGGQNDAGFDGRAFRGIRVEIEVAIEIDVVEEGAEGSAGGDGDARFAHTADHGLEAESPGGGDDTQGLGDAAGLHEFEVDPIDAFGDGRDIAVVADGFIDEDRKDLKVSEMFEIGLLALGQRLLNVLDAALGEPGQHLFGLSEGPAAIRIDSQFRLEGRGGLAAGFEMGLVMVETVRRAELDLEILGPGSGKEFGDAFASDFDGVEAGGDAGRGRAARKAEESEEGHGGLLGEEVPQSDVEGGAGGGIDFTFAHRAIEVERVIGDAGVSEVAKLRLAALSVPIRGGGGGELAEAIGFVAGIAAEGYKEVFRGRLGSAANRERIPLGELDSLEGEVHWSKSVPRRLGLRFLSSFSCYLAPKTTS